MDSYTEKIASHYATYRPPLHSIILKKVLAGSSGFQNGLDIGCGTGYSTIALADYCSTVVGIDPSQSMLERSVEHPRVNYLKGLAENIPLQDHSVDIVTFAGSLFYVDLKKVSSEMKRICKKDAVIIPYDFEILVDEPLSLLEIDLEETDTKYDHTINFSGMDGFEEIVNKEEQVNIECTGTQLAHLLLSDPHQYDRIAEKYRAENPFEKLRESLVKSGNHFFIKANLFYSKYHLAYE